jgi:carbamoyltransferase
MIILGLNAYHGDSSACLVVDGQLVAAAEEERFRRIKHWAGFPAESIKYCLEAGGITIDQVDHLAINRNPSANLMKKALFAFSKRPSLKAITDRLANAGKVKDIKAEFCEAFGVRGEAIKAKIHNVEHHKAHLASSFFVSPFDNAALVSVDGFGDFVSTMWGTGEGSRIEVRDQVNFPHSLGLFYLAITQYLGFMNYGDEYKVMGLGPYGQPTALEKMRQIVRLKPKGLFELDLDCFLHHSEGVSMVWDNGAPTMGKVYSDKLVELFGPARGKDDELTQQHKDIAASMQAMYEEAFFHLLDYVYAQTQHPNLCLAGGCAMNSVANGKVFERSPFKELYVQAAAGDGGGAIGAAFYVWHQELGNPRSFVMDHAFLGPEFDEAVIRELLSVNREELKAENCIVEKIEDVDELCRRAAAVVAEGNVLGWFQGRMEWGPRALGNRSIIGDPRRETQRDPGGHPCQRLRSPADHHRGRNPALLPVDSRVRQAHRRAGAAQYLVQRE